MFTVYKLNNNKIKMKEKKKDKKFQFNDQHPINYVPVYN